MIAARWPLRIAFAMAALSVGASPAEARRVLGAEIPDPADPLDGQAHHFVLRKPWKKVMNNLRRSYGRVPGVVIRLIDTPPSVKAYFIENTRRGRTWDGMNVYQNLRDGSVYVTVLPARRGGRAALAPSDSPDQERGAGSKAPQLALDVRSTASDNAEVTTP